MNYARYLSIRNHYILVPVVGLPDVFYSSPDLSDIYLLLFLFTKLITPFLYPYYFKLM